MEPNYLAGRHPIGISIQGGEAVFVDERSGNVFTPSGTNYLKLVNTPGGFQDRIFHPSHFNPSDLWAVFGNSNIDA